MKYFYYIILLFLFSCSEDKRKNNKYKKQSDIPITGQSLDKKSSPANKINDFY